MFKSLQIIGKNMKHYYVVLGHYYTHGVPDALIGYYNIETENVDDIFSLANLIRLGDFVFEDEIYPDADIVAQNVDRWRHDHRDVIDRWVAARQGVDGFEF